MSQTDSSNVHGADPAGAFGSFAAKYEKGTGGATRYVAQHLIEISPPFLDGSIILDNACGTGIVVEEVQKSILSASDEAKRNVKLQVYAADAAAPMIDIVRAKAKHAEEHGAWPNITSISIQAIPAEGLDESIVPSNTVTHSYMNFGLFFCSDPVKAGQHIYRSLAPGGTAFITSWADLGYLDSMRKTEKALNPGNENFKMPFSDEWGKHSYFKSMLCQSGFAEDKINIVHQVSFFRGKDLDELADLQANLYSMLIKGSGSFWPTDDAKREWIAKLREFIPDEESFVQEENGVATKMLANVAICTK